jgi:hypothetical protein
MPEAAHCPTGAPEMGRFFLLGPSTSVALNPMADMPNGEGGAYCEVLGENALAAGLGHQSRWERASFRRGHLWLPAPACPMSSSNCLIDQFAGSKGAELQSAALIPHRSTNTPAVFRLARQSYGLGMANTDYRMAPSPWQWLTSTPKTDTWEHRLLHCPFLQGGFACLTILRTEAPKTVPGSM